jgi:hypothetical protein
MGVDAEIYLKSKDGKEPELEWNLPNGYRISPANKWAPEGATHEIETAVRYYGANYERGPWPYISAVLMLLLASEDVEIVWYGGNCYDSMQICTPETVRELNDHFMAHGNRPFRRL